MFILNFYFSEIKDKLFLFLDSFRFSLFNSFLNLRKLQENQLKTSKFLIEKFNISI